MSSARFWARPALAASSRWSDFPEPQNAEETSSDLGWATENHGVEVKFCTLVVRSRMLASMRQAVGAWQVSWLSSLGWVGRARPPKSSRKYRHQNVEPIGVLDLGWD